MNFHPKNRRATLRTADCNGHSVLKRSKLNASDSESKIVSWLPLLWHGCICGTARCFNRVRVTVWRSDTEFCQVARGHFNQWLGIAWMGLDICVPITAPQGYKQPHISSSLSNKFTCITILPFSGLQQKFSFGCLTLVNSFFPVTRFQGLDPAAICSLWRYRHNVHTAMSSKRSLQVASIPFVGRKQSNCALACIAFCCKKR